jgi:hypothetical protein
MPGSSKWSSFLKSPHQNPVCTSSLPIRAACPAYLIRLDLIPYTFVNIKDWIKLKLTCFFFKYTVFRMLYIYMKFVFLAAAFQRIQVVCVDAVSFVSGSRLFESGYYGLSKRQEPLTKQHILLSQKI